MKEIIIYFGTVFTEIYNILNVQFFEDFPITYIQLIMTTVVLTFLFRFIFGGMKTVNGVENQLTGSMYMNISNYKRQLQLNELQRNEMLIDTETMLEPIMLPSGDPNPSFSTKLKDQAFKKWYDRGYYWNGETFEKM